MAEIAARTRHHPPKVSGYYTLPEADIGILVNYYHLSRAAGARSKHERMLQAVKWFVKEHPEHGHTLVYKNLDRQLAQWF